MDCKLYLQKCINGTIAAAAASIGHAIFSFPVTVVLALAVHQA